MRGLGCGGGEGWIPPGGLRADLDFILCAEPSLALALGFAFFTINIAVSACFELSVRERTWGIWKNFSGAEERD